MYVMRGLHCLHCCWGYTEFQIAITVCRFHWGHEIFRGLLQWTERILMPIISRDLNNISNVVEHWYLSLNLIRSDKKSLVPEYDTGIANKMFQTRSEPAWRNPPRGGKKPDWNCAGTREWGRCDRALGKIDNELQAANLAGPKPRLASFLWGNVGGLLESSPYLFHQSNSCSKEYEKPVKMHTYQMCYTFHYFSFLFTPGKKKICLWHLD